MKASLVFLMAVWLCLSARAGDGYGPQVGSPPPLLQATTLLQAPPGATLDAKSLQGKVVVLEFWATSCGPCVMAIPHLNQLAEKFKDQPVQFVAITAEDEATIRRFLIQRPINAWVALDTDRSMNKAYGIVSIPHTVILGRDGKIAGITHPSTLYEQDITDVLAGKKIFLRDSADDEGITPGKNPNDLGAAPPLFQVLILPSSGTNRGAAWGSGNLTARGYTLKDLLLAVFSKSPARILTNAPLPEGKYDFVVTQPPGEKKEINPLLQQAIKSAFGLDLLKETREMDVLTLKVKKPHAPGLVVSTAPGGSSRSYPGSLEGMDISMSTLAWHLECMLNKPVIDETGLATNRYDITLKWEAKPGARSNSDGLANAVQKKLGLELIPGRRAIEMLVVDPAKPPEQPE
jgi:uncharacterized protein (TIGR03435 family)